MELPGTYRPWSQTSQRARVLVVDDNELMRTLISTMLTRRGYDVVTASDGAAAIEAAQANVDVVLLDVGLPGMNGLDVCRSLRGDPATAALPIIMLTGHSDPRDVRDGLRAGASDFLTKPFDEVDLVATVNKLARRNSV